jgi:hypothetical protein
MAAIAGNAAHTSRETPAMMSLLAPVVFDGVADALVVPGVDRGAVDDLILVDDR